MIIGTTPESPGEISFGLGDRVLIDAIRSLLHQPIGFGSPVLLAIGAEPLSAVVATFVGQTHSDEIASTGPQFPDQEVVEVTQRCTGPKRLNLDATLWKARLRQRISG